MYAHHTTKAHGTRLNLHAPSLKQSQAETRIANMYHTHEWTQTQPAANGYAVRVGLVICSVWGKHRVKKIAWCLPSRSLQS